MTVRWPVAPFVMSAAPGECLAEGGGSSPLPGGVGLFVCLAKLAIPGGVGSMGVGAPHWSV